MPPHEIKLSNKQEEINGYIRHLHLKLACISHDLREKNWDNLVHTQDETLRRLKEVERNLHTAIQLLPVERGAK